MRPDNVLTAANPDDITAQIDPMGVPWLMIGEELSAALNGGSMRDWLRRTS